MSSKFLLLLSKAKPIWETLSNLYIDFINEVYSVEGTPATFDSYVTHSRSGNATMTDSDGLIKWAPHNICLQSENINTTWVANNATPTQSTEETPDGDTSSKYIKLVDDGSTGTNSVTISQTITVSGGAQYTASAFLKKDGLNWGRFSARNTGGADDDPNQYFDLDNGVLGTGSAGIQDATIEEYPNDWYRCSITWTQGAGDTSFNFRIDVADGDGDINVDLDGTSSIFVWGAHVYRSDLGGMVDNPDRGDSYVPTTSSAAYLPRRGHHVYNGSTFVNEGLLVESESRQNICLQSEDFSTTWTASADTTVTANNTTAPDGNSTADKLGDDGATGTGSVYVNQSITVTGGTKYTASVFLKKSGLDWARLRAENTGGVDDDPSQFFDLDTGVLGSGTAGIQDATIEEYSNGWYRCSITWTQGAGDTSFGFRIYVADGDNDTSVDLDGTSSIFVWGAQVEEGSTPSSYIPTAGSAITRAAETLTIPLANLPYDSTNMSIQMDGRMTYADEDSLFQEIFLRWRKDGDTQIQVGLDTNSTTTGAIRFRQEAGGVIDDNASSNIYSPDILVPYNIASRHGSTFINGAVDGTALTANTTPTALPDLSSTDLDLAYDYMGTIRTFRIWDDDLTDEGIEFVST